MSEPRRDALSTDLYQITMAAAYHASGQAADVATFELFARKFPGNRGYLVACGVGDAIDYLESLSFHEDEIAYLQGLPVFRHVSPSFFEFLARLRFTGRVDALEDGTPVFPGEPILVVTAPIVEAQIVETYLLSVVNFETLVATKGARVVDAARGRAVVDFGTRRAHGPEAGFRAARAAFVAGAVGTSNVLAGFRLGIPVFGTFAHSYVMAQEDEVEAFRAYQRVFPESTTLLVDTYDTVAAVRTAVRAGIPFQGIRLDSGDLAALARECRAVLDAGDRRDARIVCSGDLNEWKIRDLVAAGAPVDIFGVGTELVTSKDAPALGGVYKLMAIEHGGKRRFPVKLSAEKATWPGKKQIYRARDADGRASGDLVALADEPPPQAGEPMLRPLLVEGKRAAPATPLALLRSRCLEKVSALPPGVRDIDRPAPYPVEMSRALSALAEEARAAGVRRRVGARNAHRVSWGGTAPGWAGGVDRLPGALARRARP